MITVENFTSAALFVRVNEEKKQTVDAAATLQLGDWAANDRLRIGYAIGGGGDGEWLFVDNSQSLTGTFRIEQDRRVPRISFTPDATSSTLTAFTDEQYRRVGKVFECECARDACSCMQDAASRRANCEHLVRLGVLNEAQLDACIEEMF
jgi:hypothetical protein